MDRYVAATDAEEATQREEVAVNVTAADVRVARVAARLAARQERAGAKDARAIRVAARLAAGDDKSTGETVAEATEKLGTVDTDAKMAREEKRAVPISANQAGATTAHEIEADVDAAPGAFATHAARVELA